MALTDHQRKLITAVANNNISEAKKCAIVCVTEDKTMKNKHFCDRYKQILTSSNCNMMELPYNMKGLLYMEDVSNSFNENRYFLSRRESSVFENITRMKRVSEKLLEIGIPYLNSTLLYGESGTRAILDGRKTVTRRVIKPANAVKANCVGGYYQGNGLWINDYSNSGKIAESIKDYSVSYCWQKMKDYMEKYVPKVGDVLYVRETWGRQTRHGGVFMVYKADNLNAKNYDTNASGSYETRNVKWLPSVRMRKETARIFLKVIAVRAGRLQDMDNPHDQVLKEGYPFSCITGTPIHDFALTWNSIIKKQELDNYGWDANPWVWVIEFEVMEVG